VCALSTKLDVLLDWLEQRANYKRDHQAIQDTFNAKARHDQENANIINNLSMQQKQGWNQQK
jgi:hypothetical protein